MHVLAFGAGIVTSIWIDWEQNESDEQGTETEPLAVFSWRREQERSGVPAAEGVRAALLKANVTTRAISLWTWRWRESGCVAVSWRATVRRLANECVDCSPSAGSEKRRLGTPCVRMHG